MNISYIEFNFRKLYWFVWFKNQCQNLIEGSKLLIQTKILIRLQVQEHMLEIIRCEFERLLESDLNCYKELKFMQGALYNQMLIIKTEWN